MKNKVLLTLIITVLCILVFGAICVSAASSGTCGANIRWTLDDEGVLTITGTGEMVSWERLSDVPWYLERMSIQSVIIGDGITSIGSYAFSNCTNLTNIEIPGSIITIGDYALAYCEHITKVDLPDGITRIGDYAFYLDTSMENLTIPASTISIGAWAYSCGSTGMTSTLIIPEDVTYIGDYAFANYRSLTKLVWNAKNVSALTTTSYLFNNAGADGMEVEVIFGNSVEQIPEYAFRTFHKGPVIKTVEIGSSVQGIGNYAFYGCHTITDVYYNGTEEKWGDIVIGTNNESLTDATIHFVTDIAKTPAQALCDAINEQTANSCEVDIDTQTVRLLSDVYLTQTLEIPEESTIKLDIANFNIYGADDQDAINIQINEALVVKGNGTIYGGNAQEGFAGCDAIYNAGVLVIVGPTLKGGDAIDEYSKAGEGVGFSWETYLVEGEVIAGKGEYSGGLLFESLTATVLKESDDGINYTAVKNWTGDKRYIKGVKIPDGLSAPEKLCAILNEIASGTCVRTGNTVKLNRNFSCPHEIHIPTGAAIILDFNGYTVTTHDFFMPFIIPEQAEITFSGTGTLTNKEQALGHPGGVGAGASLISNEGKLIVDGITMIGVGLSGIANDGDLIINRGKITAMDSATGRDAIYNMGTITVNGGEIIGGDATSDGRNGGDGISGGPSAIPIGGIYPIKLNGGILHGGKGLGTGEDGRAISKSFCVGENSVAYESDDGTNYLKFEDTRCYMQYLKIEKKTIETAITVQNVELGEGKISFDVALFLEEQIAGTVYVAVYEGERLSYIKPYVAAEEIPVSVDYAEGQKIKVFWWGENLSPISLPKEVPMQ